jgi:hypothetical protein
VIQRIARGVSIALRSGVAPLFVGARLAGRRAQAETCGVPDAPWSLALASKIALDEIFYATELASLAVVPLREGRRVVDEMEQALDLFGQRGWLADPRRYHPKPPALGRAMLRPGRFPGLSYRHLCFESGYEPNPGEPGRERWQGYRANRSAHAWILQHRGRPRPWLVCIPGYRMGTPLVDFTAFRARWLHKTLGINVAIPVMPLHGPRRAGLRGGDGYFAGDFLDTLHALAQALWDVRRLVGWIQDEGAPAVGLYGISLGGYTTALVASFADDLDCAIAGIPATDFMRLVRAHVPRVVLRGAEMVGLSVERLETLLSVVSPFSFRPRLARRRRFLYAGTRDRLAPPDHARDLWRHWDEPRIGWYSGGHVSFLCEPAVKSFLLEALRDAQMLPERGHW